MITSVALTEEDIAEVWNGRPDCAHCSVRHLALFANLREADFALVHRQIKDERLEPGDVLYHAEETASAVFTVRTGLIKLEQINADGVARIVRLLRPGNAVGLEALDADTYEHSAIAIDDTTLCRIPVPAIRRLTEETHRMTEALIHQWHLALQSSDRWMTQLQTGPSERRVAGLIEELADVATGMCRLPTRQDMGAILGLTTETTSRIVARFRREGLLVSVHGNRMRADLARVKALTE